MPPIRREHDLDLHQSDVTVLDSRDQVREFFHKLGYDVNDKTVLNNADLGMDTDELNHNIRHIIRIARDDDDEISVLLFEMRSVTVTLIQQITQKLSDRAGDFLLVMTATNDRERYENLTFVLLERIKSEKSNNALRYVRRPRTLTVNRRHPTPVNLRVLKRFTYTETDGLYQWDKLKSAYTLAEWTEPEFNNRALFSDYYLKHRLTDRKLHPIWNEDARRIHGDINPLIAGARDRLSKQPESTTRADLIEPLFKLLGFTATPIKSDDSAAIHPDYELRDSAGKLLALALTYKWNRNLDADDRSRPDSVRDNATPDENPGALVVSLLERADAPAWVIMTNGKLWRLYSATASNKITNYYEIDLEEALFAPNQDTEASLKYWWLLFRREAFDGLLDKIRAESQDYAKRIGDSLKKRIFEKIFGYFAGGFIQHMRDQGLTEPAINAQTDLIFTATMTFLYRLMFVLYAESLELLPVKEENGYGASSLKALKQQIADIADKILDEADDKLQDHYDTDSTDLYQRLKTLFSAIDKGSADFNLPTYNGGLFSAESPAGAFLDQYMIPDVYLAIGLDRLARDVDEKRIEDQTLVFIDYKALGVRQLGSIYEGLLEFKLRIAQEKLAVIKDGKREIYVPHAKAVKDKTTILEVKKQGDVYIANTKEERKATGSYYTPDYIVKYIVEHTCGPVLQSRFDVLAPRLRKAQSDYAAHKKNVSARKDFQPPELFWAGQEMQQLADDCLNIRVLDPAMGSGHFLVEVVDYISNRLIDFLNAWRENPVWAMIKRTREDILTEMTAQGVSIDAGKLTDVVLLKRAVLKRCIYGVDLNSMAVELAKVSLWLDAFTLGAPLSFLDHHLKHGNSLIGARIADVQEALGKGGRQVQLNLFAQSQFTGLMMATDLMRQVSYLSDNTINQTQQSRNAYRSANDHLAPYKRVLDMYTSRWFGNTGSKRKGEQFEPTIEFLNDPQAAIWLKNPLTKLKDGYIKFNQIASTAQTVAEDKRFFHWELEFPEVFFAPSTPDGSDIQLRKNGGFDAVVGNPPYKQIEELPNFENLPSDTFVYFWSLLFKYVRDTGTGSFIVPSAWLTGANYLPLRKLVIDQGQIKSVVILPYDVFPDAYIDTCIAVIEKGRTTASYPIMTRHMKKNEHGSSLPTVELFPLNSDLWRNDPQFRFVLNSVVLKMRKFDQLGQVTELATITRAERGVQPYGREKHTNEQIQSDFLRAKQPPKGSKVIYYPELLGEELSRYDINPQKRNWLEYSDRLAGKRDEIMFNGPRVVLRRLLSRRRQLMSAVTSEKLITSDNVINMLVTASHWEPSFICSLLNSTLLAWLYTNQSTIAVKDDFPQITLIEVGSLPIPRISFTTPTDRRSDLSEKGRKLYTRSLSEGHDCVLEFTDHHLSLNESDVIHDLLAFLAQQMIDLNKSKRTEVKRFLAWLESQLEIKPNKDGDVGIDSLKKKTKLQNYLGDYQKGEAAADFDETIWDALYENRTRFGVGLAALRADIQREYQKSLDALIPIKGQLATTDALIDRVVYQLYGLTDDEIRLIEYPAFEQKVTSAKADAIEEVQQAAREQKPKPTAAELVAETAAAPVLTPEQVDDAIDKIAQTIEDASGEYLLRVPEPDAEARLRTSLPMWDTLPVKVRTFLHTGEMLLEHSNLPDYSPVVVSFGKAAENILNERIFFPFRQQYTYADCDNEFLQKFMRSKDKTLSLGSMPIVLASSAEQALRNFITLKLKAIVHGIFDPNGLLRLLDQRQINQYRNSAAHDAILTADDARAARQWVIDIIGYV